MHGLIRTVAQVAVWAMALVGLASIALALWFYYAEVIEPPSQQARLNRLVSALEFYQIDTGRYPTTGQGLRALLSKPEVSPIPERYRLGGYLQSPELLTDLWGNPVQYRHPGAFSQTGFDLWSFGPDGRAGGLGEHEADIIVSR